MSTIGVRNTQEKRRSGLLIALLLLVTVAAVAIGLSWSALAARGGGATVDSPRSVWADQAVDDYRYTVQVGCFCIREMTRPVVVEVADGALLSLTYADDGTAADPLLFERFTSVEKLYAVIDDAAAQNAVQLDVTYDEALGVPTQISIDISQQMADEELYLTISGFEALD